MKLTRQIFATLLTLLAACLTQAADSKPIARVIAIQEIETDDPTGYATWVAKINDTVKAKFGIDTYLHVYVSAFDGEKTNSVRYVASGESVAALTKIATAVESDPAVAESRDHLRAIRKLGSRVLYQAVRFDGTYKGSYVYSTTAVVADESGYLKALDQLRALLDQNGLQDMKINVYRVMAGRSNFTHRVTLAAPTNEKLAAFLDFVGTSPAAAEWLAATAKFRTVVGNTTAHDIIK